MTALFSLSSKKSALLLVSQRLLFPTPLSPPSLHRTLHGLHSTPDAQPPSIPSRILEPSATQISQDDTEDDTMNEFLSRVVHSLRPTLSAALPALQRPQIDAMLLLICQRVASEIDGPGGSDDPPVDLSADLWEAVREASAAAHEAMRRDRMRAEMKKYLHCEEVKQMCHFAGDIGIRGSLLRELRFKWAREKLEEVEFYRGLDKMREQDKKEEEAEKGLNLITAGGEEGDAKLAVIDSLPQRKGKIKYKIYGLDLSGPNWAEVAERAEEAEQHFVPEEPKPIEGKCRKVEEKILALGIEDDPSLVLAEWKELLGPRRVDWLALLERIKKWNVDVYFMVCFYTITFYPDSYP